MTIEQIDRMVRGANPVPDLRALEPVDLSDLRFALQRSEDMQTQDQIELDREPEPRNRGLLIGVAAAVVLVLIGALIYFQSREQAPVVTQAPESEAAVEIATGFVEAYAGYDTEAAASYLAEGALVSLFQNTGEDWQTGNRFMETAELKLLPGQCEQVSTNPTQTTVRCPFDYHSLGSEQIGRGPFTDSSITVTVEGGEIVSAVMSFEFMANGFSAQMWEPFGEWIRENHPEDIPIMYADGDRQTLESHSDESAALWAQRIAEYVEVVGQTSP